MTESEAKTKWCCGPKLVADQMLSNRLMAPNQPAPNPPEHNGLCIGSACMAWRDNWGVNPDNPTGSPVVVGGYCGLAGRA